MASAPSSSHFSLSQEGDECKCNLESIGSDDAQAFPTQVVDVSKTDEAPCHSLPSPTTNATKRRSINITVYNDFACAWCSIGQKRLTKAIQMYRDLQHPNAEECIVHVDWKPFQVDPNVAVGGELFDEYCERRFGGIDWMDRLRQLGEPDGVMFKNWKWFPNTRKAHQLILYYTTKKEATSNDMVCKLIGALFDAVFEKGENISLVESLVQIAVSCDATLDEEELRRFLQHDEGADEVHQQMEAGQNKYNLSAVPFYILSSRRQPVSEPIELSGVQDAELICDLLNEL